MAVFERGTPVTWSDSTAVSEAFGGSEKSCPSELQLLQGSSEGACGAPLQGVPRSKEAKILERIGSTFLELKTCTKNGLVYIVR